jgi:small subunit ribosomal protein S6
MNNYETVFILTPVLSDDQMKEAVEKFKSLLIEEGAEIVNEEDWGLRKLAYPIDKKTTGFYAFLEFKAEPHVIEKLEVNFRRDERVIRYLTVKLDKFALEYAEKRRNKSNKSNKKQDAATMNDQAKPKRAERSEGKAEKPEVKAEKRERIAEKPESKVEGVETKAEKNENPTPEPVSQEDKDETPESKVEITETEVDNPEPKAEGLENVEEEVELKEKED